MSDHIMKTGFGQTKTNVTSALAAGLVPFVRSSPGMGKSSMFREIAKESGLVFLDLRAGEMDPTEIKGFPFINSDGKSAYAPNQLIPTENDKVPEGKNGWLLLCDELPSAVQAVQVAMYRLLLDRMVGDTKVHKKVYMAAAGNLETDNAVVEEMSTALKSRMVTFYLASDQRQWAKWAIKNKIHNAVIAYLSHRTNYINRFDPRLAMEESNFCCERTWEFMSKALSVSSNSHLVNEPSKNISFYAGVLGESTATEFAGFLELIKQSVTIDQIIQDPTGTPAPEKSEQKWSIALSIADSIEDDNADQLLEYLLNKLGVEFQILSISKMNKRKPTIVGSHPKISDWITKNANRMY